MAQNLPSIQLIDNVNTIKRIGLKWPRLFGGDDPYADIVWEQRTAKITKSNGEVVFEQENVEVPNFWSQTATDIVASKYFRGKIGSLEREQGAREMIDRVADTIALWGFHDGYFSSKEDYENFKNDLKWLLIHQYASFNSPVWFNVGVFEKPQCSACFIISVEDTMGSILEWYETEGWIFKGGSGSGLNLSRLRSSKEPLSKGGFSSGPVSFMKGADGVANSIRSGGTTRRAAKMIVLNVDHPDIRDFIYCKKYIEDMSKILQKGGVEDAIDAELFHPYTLLPYQNANNSVRVSDEFMYAVEKNDEWELRAVTTGEVLETVRAREVLRWCADAAWHSADPGMQYDTTINAWHTCPASGRITASNPCAEYMHLDNSACNLASINVLKFYSNGDFDVERFKNVVDTFILAQDIIVDRASYLTEKIRDNAHNYRQLGLGYTNLGALIMAYGLPYDSEEGRFLGASITALLCGEAYHMSSLIAQKRGTFNGYIKNRKPMLEVIEMHRDAAQELLRGAQGNGIAGMNIWPITEAAVQTWNTVVNKGQKYGFRNAQTTVIAPTGTISFMMDATTTGIEPELALVKYKKLVGGGMLKLVNTQVKQALHGLQYTDQEIKEIEEYLLEKEMIEGAPHLKDEHLAVFDCSFKPLHGKRSIAYAGHLKMMGATQPFISGAISKTVNLPNDATVEDIEKAFIESWKLGLKAVAFYRDGSKGIQPLNLSKDEKLVETFNGYTRFKLPTERPSITHKFSVRGYEGYLTVGFYPETKRVGEIFIVTAKEGSTISGLFDTIATLTSMCLQSGVPLKILVKKFKDMRFEPAGFTENKAIPIAKSIIDYIFTYLGVRFLAKEEREEVFGPDTEKETNESINVFPVNNESVEKASSVSDEMPIESRADEVSRETHEEKADELYRAMLTAVASDAPACSECGTMMNKAGSCYACPNCFYTTGACN